MAAHLLSRIVAVGVVVFLCVAISPQAALASPNVPSDSISAQANGSSAEVFLVFPFENPGRTARLDWLGEGLEELTIERLAAAGQQLFTHEERLAALEKSGLPASTRFSRATMLKIAEDMDADFVIFGRYAYDGKNLRITASLLRVSPPGLVPAIQESGSLEEFMDIHQRLAWRVLRAADPSYRHSQQEFAKMLRPLRLDAFEHYIRGLLAADDEQRTRNLREAARLEPDWVDPAYALGKAYYARRDCDNALAWFSRVPPANGRGAEASFYSGVCHLQRDDAARAEAAFSGLLARYASGRNSTADLPEVLNNLAIAHERLGKSREAESELRRAAQLDPEDVDYDFNQALAGVRGDDPASAVEPLRELLRREPDDPEAWALLVSALEKSGRASEAASERESGARETGAKSLTSLKPEGLARMDRVKMRFDVAALRDLEEPAVDAASTDAQRGASGRQLHLKRGRQYLAAGKLQEAQREFSGLLGQSAQDAAAHQGLAEVYRRQGKLEDAIGELRAAIEIRNDAAARTTLARLYLEQKKPDQARAQLQLALKLAPGYTEALALLDKLGSKQGSGESR
ncbi:MAG TPA: tetratricopeptide repeat protein [Candidatus Acidoferrales bacterium]|nr:tetratricopeptide repeat protein [Candidatus Acidoferrales bacterium]